MRPASPGSGAVPHPTSGQLPNPVYKTIMRPLSRPICAGSIAAFLAASLWLPTPARPAIVYWDTNGDTAGAGGTSPGGTWGTNAIWNSVADGTGSTSAWAAGDIAVFSAGTDATGAYTVSITGTQSIGGLVFEDGTVTLSGGMLDLAADSSFSVLNGLAARIDSNLSGAFALNKTGLGSLRLGANNSDFSGPITISGGILSVASVDALGTGTSQITITGTTTRGLGGGQLVLGGSIGAGNGLTINRPIFASGGGPGGDGAALLSVGDNTLSDLTTGATSATRLYAAGGTTIVTAFEGGVGQNSQFNGPGHWILSGVNLSGQANTLLQKAGAGGMILTGTNLIDNEVRASGGSLRIDNGLGLPVLSSDSGVLEIRTDNVGSFVDTRLIERGSAQVFADRAVGSTAGLLNQTLVFSDTSYANNNVTHTYLSRNGYNITLSGAGSDFGNITFTGGNNLAIVNNSSSGTLTLAGNLTFGSETTVRAYTFTGHGDTVITGNISAAGGVHRLDKGSATVGNGTLTLLGTNSNYLGGTNINSGTLAIENFGVLGPGAVNLGTLSTGVGAFSYAGAGETSAKVFISPGTNSTSGGIILANHAGASPLVLTGGLASTGTAAKTIHLGGSNALDNVFGAPIQNNGPNVTSLAKIGGGTWIYSPSVDSFSTGATPTTGASTTNVGTASSGQSDITLASTAGILIGHLVTGTNVPSGSTVTEINGNVITISNTITTAISDATALRFGSLISANSFIVSSTVNIVPGQVVSGTNVPAGSVVTAVDTGTNTVTISSNIGTSIGGDPITFGAVSSFTGSVTVAGGTLKIQPTATSGAGSDLLSGGLIFNADLLSSNQWAGGTFEYVGLSGEASSETLGALNANAGASTVKVTPTGGGSAALTFTGTLTGANGSGLNIVVPAGAGNSVTVTGATTTNGIVNAHVYYNGADFARATSGVLGPATYTDISGNQFSNTTTNPVRITGSFMQSTTPITFNAGIKFDSAQTLTLGSGVTMTIQNGGATVAGGILVTGGVSATITGGTGITSGGSADLVVRTDTASDVLNLTSPVLSTTTGGITKNGAGTLVLGGANAQTGTVTVNEGTLRLATGGALGGTNINLTVRQGATFDLGGVNVGTSPTAGGANALNGAGTITNSAASGVALLRVGNPNAASIFSGVIQDGLTAQVQLAKGGTGTLSLTGLNTFTGPMTVAAGIVNANSLADIGVPSSIGSGIATDDTTNAASLVFAGGTLRYIGANNNSPTSVIVQATQTPSVSINRLFTIAAGGTVNATIESSGTYGNNSAGTGQSNNATLVFNNTAPILFSGAGARSLALGGTSTSDNEFRPRLTNNGTSGGALTLIKQGAGLWILNPNALTPNTYTGTTRIDQGALQAVDGIGLPSGSNLQFAGGVFQSSGTFTRMIGSSGGRVQVSNAGGGFAAAESKLTVMLNNGSGTVTWGDPSFDPNPLILGSTSALSEVEVTNSFDLSTTVRVVQVDDNTNTALDFARLSGVLSNGGLSKTGAGVLYLTGANTHDMGTTVSAGTLVVNSFGTAASPNSNLGVGSGALMLSGGTLQYVGPGITSNRTVNLTASTTLDATGAGPLVLTNFANVATGALTLTLTGSSADANEIRSNLAQNGTNNLSVTKSGAGVWILSGNNQHGGTTTLGGNGALGIGHDNALGTGLLSVLNASIFAAGADRTIANNVLFRGNATEAVYGDFSLTIGGNVTFGDNGGSTTLSNFIAPGKLLTINGTVTNADTGTNRTLTINGTGTTLINGTIQNQLSNTRVTTLTYSGTGLLILGPAAANTYTGSTNASGGAIQATDAVQTGLYTTVETANNSTTLTVANTSGLTVGQSVYGSNIAVGTTIASIDGGANTVTLSAPTTATVATGTAIGFGTANGSLPGLSNLALSGGVFQVESGSFDRALGTGPGAARWNGSGGFAAVGMNLELDFPDETLVWGGGTPGPDGADATPSFITGGNSLIFGSNSATAEVIWRDNLDLNNSGSGVTRTIVVNDNPAVNSDLVRIGVEPNSLVQSGTGATALTKTGNGTLIIEKNGADGSNSFGGTIAVTGGTLVINGSPNAPAANAGALTMTPSATGTNLVLGPGVTLVRQSTFTANANAFAGGINISGAGVIHLNSLLPGNVNPIGTRAFVIGDNPLVTDDVTISVPLLNGDSSAVTHISRQGPGKLVLTAENDWEGALSHFRGMTVIDYTSSTGGRLSDLGDIEMRGGALVLQGNAGGAVNELVGNLSPGGSNLGPYGGGYNTTTMMFNRVNPSPTGADPDSTGSLVGTAATAAPLGSQSTIQLQPVNGQALSMTFAGFIRNPGGGVTILSTTNPALGTFRTPQFGNANDGRLLTTSALINGRWLARDTSTNQIVPFFGTLQNDPSQWDATRSFEIDGTVANTTLATHRVAGLIFSGADSTTLDIDNTFRTLTLGNGAILVTPQSTAPVIEIAGGKLLTEQPYRSAPGADILLQNFSPTSVLKISSNLGHSDAPQGNTELITIAGGGTVELAGQSASMLTYFGATLLRGAVKVIGGSTLRVSGGDAISDYLPLDLGAVGDVGGNFQLNGATETIGGLVTPVNTNQGVGGGSIDLGSGGALTLNQQQAVTYSGTLTGTGTLIKQGNATLTSNGNALTFSGELEIRGGVLLLNSNATHGLTGNITDVLLSGGAIEAEHNSGGLLSINKLPDAATFTLESTFGNGLRIFSNTSGRSETIKAVVVSSGASTITIDATVGSVANTSQLTLNVTDATNALTRANRGTLLVRGDNLGGGLGGSLNNTTRILLGSGPNGLGLGGQGSGATPASYPIVPWMIGATGDGSAATSVGNSFVTYGPNGLRPLNTASEYATSYAAAGTNDNLSLNADTTGVTGKTINSLRIDTSGGDVNLTAAGSQTLTLNSGAILMSAGASANGATIDLGIGGSIVPTTNELVIGVTSSNATPSSARLAIASPLFIGSAAITKTGNGTLVLPSGSAFFGGLTVNQGAVEFLTANALGSGVVRLAGGTLQYPAAGTVTITQAIETHGPSSFYTPTGTGAAGNALNRGSTINVMDQGGVLVIDGPSAPSGTGGLVKLGRGTLTLSDPATYAGATAILQGNANFHSIRGASGLAGDLSAGLFLIPENLLGAGTPSQITVNVTNDLNVNQLIVGGVFTAASSGNGEAFLFVGTPSVHPVVNIGNGGGDSFLLVGYHDEGAANGAGTPAPRTRGTLDLQHASAVNINVSRIFISQNKGAGSGLVDGDVFLSNGTNNVTTGYLVVGSSPGPDSTAGIGNVSRLSFGTGTTNLNADSIIIGGQSTNALAFLGLGGTLNLRDRSGTGGADLYIGDNDDITNSQQSQANTALDTSSGVINAKLNLLVVGRHGGNTATTSNAGGGQGALRFGVFDPDNPTVLDASVVEVQTVRLAQISSRGVTNTGPDPTPDNTTRTEGVIEQFNGTFRFGEMSAGGGKATYNWFHGVIENLPGRDAVNHNVIITPSGTQSGEHFLSVTGNQTMTFGGSAGFSGDAALRKIGSGTLILQGASTTYSGDSYINQGRVLANNIAGSALGGGLVEVASGAELGGSGSISGETTIKAGGKLSVGGTPGAIGAFHIGSSLILDAESILQLEIQTNLSTPLADTLSLDGTLFIDDFFGNPGGPDGDFETTAILSITDLDPRKLGDETRLTLINAQGSWDGVGLFKITDPFLGEQVIEDFVAGDPNSGTLFYIGSNGFKLDYNGGNGTLVQLVAVPEPGALASLVGGLGMLLGLQRFRRGRMKG